MDVQIYDSIQAFDSVAWDALAGRSFPFASYHFLHALETTDCLGDRTGWYPCYVVARKDARPVGALICFVKTNSYGEYIFDWAWAQGAEAGGIPYYPKLTSAIPFTPATGSKMLIAADLTPEQRDRTRTAVLDALAEFAARSGVSSTHALFVPAAEVDTWTAAGYTPRDSFQFHWRNAGYPDFAAFLNALTGKRRREIRRERAQVTASGVNIRRLTGSDLSPEVADRFHEFYLSTIDKRGSYEYLTKDFFRVVFATMADRLMVAWAETAEREPVAGALNYFGSDALFGRHWGCLAEHRALHFELCYYQGLEFAIARGFARFEAGAQGEHKLQRGFLPVLTHSVHRITHPGLDQGVRHYIAAERLQIARQMTELNAHSPFGYG